MYSLKSFKVPISALQILSVVCLNLAIKVSVSFQTINTYNLQTKEPAIYTIDDLLNLLELADSFKVGHVLKYELIVLN